MLGQTDNTYKGFTYYKVYRDENGTPFEHGVAKYAAYYEKKLLGYADTDKKAEELYLKYMEGRK